MVKYQGSKQRYAGSIQKAMLGFGKDYYNLPFWECCCGSAEVSAFLGKRVNLVDMGPWGRFWEAVAQHGKLILEMAETVDPDQYEDWVKTAVESPVPKDPIVFAMTFLALQREAFNGKPIEIVANSYWRSPGLGRQFSHKQWIKAVRRAVDLRIGGIHVVNLNHFTVPGAANIYLDPDYEDTTGYAGRTVDVGSFVRRHAHCNLVVSHHTHLAGITWDKIIDITLPGRKNFTKDNSEYLHIRKRKNETASAFTSKLPEPVQPHGDGGLQHAVLPEADDESRLAGLNSGDSSGDRIGV